MNILNFNIPNFFNVQQNLTNFIKPTDLVYLRIIGNKIGYLVTNKPKKIIDPPTFV